MALSMLVQFGLYALFAGIGFLSIVAIAVTLRDHQADLRELRRQITGDAPMREVRARIMTTHVYVSQALPRPVVRARPLRERAMRPYPSGLRAAA